MDPDFSNIVLFAFDFDGTLIHSNHIKHQSFYKALDEEIDNETTLNIAKNILTNILQKTESDRYKIFESLCSNIPELNLKKLVQKYSERCHRSILAAPEIDGATKLLQTIKQLNKNTIINSATPQSALNNIIKNHSFSPYVDEIYGAPSPKAQNLRSAMTKYNIEPAHVLVIGDRENDRIAAEQTSCIFAAIKSDISDFKTTPKYIGENLRYITKAINHV